MKNFYLDEKSFIETIVKFKIFDKNCETEIKKRPLFFMEAELSLLEYMIIRDIVELGKCKGDINFVYILIMMFAAIKNGSLCIDIDQYRFVKRLSESTKSEVRKNLADFLSNLEKGNYQKVICIKKDDKVSALPLVFDQSKNRKLLYFHKYYVYEKLLKKRMESVLVNNRTFKKEGIDYLIKEIYQPDSLIRIGDKKKPLIKDDIQIKAIKLVLESSFGIISGGPGTGKTSLMVNILRCLVRSGYGFSAIMLGAPTGRAAQRITDAVSDNILSIKKPSKEDLSLLNLKGNTLHKLLKYNSFSNNFLYNSSNPLPAEVIIIDEVSMVDLFMMEKLLGAIDTRKTKVIFMGDKDQLPSVDAGAVFKEMVPTNISGKFADKIVVLKTVYRSGESLFKFAKSINRGVFPEFNSAVFEEALNSDIDKWAFVSGGDKDKLKKHIRLWVENKYLYNEKRSRKNYKDLIKEAENIDSNKLADSRFMEKLLEKIFSFIKGARILSIVKNGVFGCRGINYFITKHISEVLDKDSIEDNVFSGNIIIITKNDYAKELFNGDIGVIIKDKGKNYKAYFPKAGKYRGFYMNTLLSWETAFAMTVHKSQGSEFDNVLLILPEDEEHRLLTREIVYTAVTRAKKSVIIYGTKTGIKTALSRKTDRDSGLNW